MKLQSKWSRGSIVVGIVLVLALALALAWSIHRLLGPPPRATIGRDTTWLDGPVDANGDVDYDAAWRHDHATGVTPENNAAPVVFAASGLDTRRFTAEERALLPEVPTPFVPSMTWQWNHPESFPPGGESDGDAIATAIDAADLDGVESEAIADWFAAVDASLDLVSDATTRPRFYLPDAADPVKRQALVDEGGLLQDVGCALAGRAFHLASKGQQERACAGFEAALRLAALERSLDVGEFVGIADATELEAWKLARQLDDVGSGVSAVELTRLRNVDVTTVEQRLRRLLSAVRVEALRDFLTTLRQGGPSRATSIGPFDRLRRLMLRQIDPDPGCRRINASLDAIETTLFANSSWIERVTALQEDLCSREREQLRRLAEDVLFPNSRASSEKIADAILFSVLHDALPTMIGVVHCVAEADLALAELGARCHAGTTGAFASTSDELTPLLFERPFRDRLLGLAVAFARDERGRIVARGALADLERQLAAAADLPAADEKEDGESK